MAEESGPLRTQTLSLGYIIYPVYTTLQPWGPILRSLVHSRHLPVFMVVQTDQPAWLLTQLVHW